MKNTKVQKSDENEFSGHACMHALTKHVKLKSVLEGKNPSKVGAYVRTSSYKGKQAAECAFCLHYNIYHR